jgi:hypothetical protein
MQDSRCRAPLRGMVVQLPLAPCFTGMQDAGFKMQDSRYWVQDSRYWVQDAGFHYLQRTTISGIPTLKAGSRMLVILIDQKHKP